MSPSTRRISPLLAVAVAAVAGQFAISAAHAAEWLGANVGPVENISTDIDLADNWSTGLVPTSTEPAVMNWSSAVSHNQHGILVGPTASFNAASLTLNSALGTGYLQIDKNLTLTNLTVTAGGTSNGYFVNRYRMGLTAPTTFTLTSSAPLNTETWQLFQVGTTHKTEFRFTNAVVNIPTMPSNDARANIVNGSISGGNAVQDVAQQAATPEFIFEAEGGTINIGPAGIRNDGNLNLGNVGLAVRSDQTWNADPTSYIRFNYRIGSSGVTGPQAIRRIDAGGTRLDNLDTLNLVIVGGSSGTGSNTTTAMRFPGGEYGSLRFAFGSTSYRDNHLMLDGSVHFKGNIVNPGSNVAGGAEATANSDYGLAIQSGSAGTNARSHKYLVLNGHTVTVDSGLLLEDFGAAQTGSAAYVARVDAANSTLNVGGDITIRSHNANRTALAVNPSFFIARGVGITGNATTVINVGGSYTNNAASVSGGTLGSSTINFIGGTGGFKNFEVADDASRVAHVTTNGTFNIGTVSVGTASAPGMVRLVNEFLNDNPIALEEDPDLAKIGEKLIARTLIVSADSVLDVNAQHVLIGAGSLEIASTGLLNLNSGLSLNEGDTVGFFRGIGDQTTTWNLYAGQVSDSTNPMMLFSAVQTGGFTMWQASAIPEPAAMGLIGLAGLGLLRRRRNA